MGPSTLEMRRASGWRDLDFGCSGTILTTLDIGLLARGMDRVRTGTQTEQYTKASGKQIP